MTEKQRILQMVAAQPGWYALFGPHEEGERWTADAVCCWLTYEEQNGDEPWEQGSTHVDGCCPSAGIDFPTFATLDPGFCEYIYDPGAGGPEDAARRFIEGLRGRVEEPALSLSEADVLPRTPTLDGDA
jgi:rubredoxin